MAAYFDNNLQYLVNWYNQGLVNFNASKTTSLSFTRLRELFLHSITMAEANLQECKSLSLLDLQFPTDIELHSHSLCLLLIILVKIIIQDIFSHLNLYYTFRSPSFVRALSRLLSSLIRFFSYVSTDSWPNPKNLQCYRFGHSISVLIHFQPPSPVTFLEIFSQFFCWAFLFGTSTREALA